MEQHRTRPPQSPPLRRGAPLPPQAGRGGTRTARQAGAGVPSTAPAVSPLVQAVRRFPNPRLTGLGSGLFCAAVMFALACLDALLFGSSLVVYGVLFLPVCALTAVWVRRADLVTAVVAVPIAFAVGLLPIADSSGGFFGRVMGLVTALALHAGWLYGGTLVAGLIVTVRKVRMMSRRAAQRRRAAA
ncbi:hypothetical protein OG418_32270 [Streptomyces phaeochromogenes]|uniref:DUF6542 domain-containing protein n=1 Tax=Streptomyces phaeochromogenes TaxID=1923 RepID=A0ABZ1HAZ7_STRPH|nr:DUF6542 domain-containing protein [Streptomyces phaeochromogenes]WRZ29614.1 hypothetical protein OG931_18555 [Streptomyces phaeochromogenes]WSD15350.1 hypothetical protein OHB35_20005 [Streptomyces phaeochromogenes]WSJ07820.1 hypothetical protein OG437_31405 [Streptomyces phaeochromogenes]